MLQCRSHTDLRLIPAPTQARRPCSFAQFENNSADFHTALTFIEHNSSERLAKLTVRLIVSALYTHTHSFMKIFRRVLNDSVRDVYAFENL